VPRAELDSCYTNFNYCYNNNNNNNNNNIIIIIIIIIIDGIVISAKRLQAFLVLD